MPDSEYISSPETSRQFRLIKMYVDTHGHLRDKFNRFALLFELFLLIFSLIGCVFAFACDDFYTTIRTTPLAARLSLGIISIIAFIGSLFLLLFNPRGKAADHADALASWTKLLGRFRNSETKDDTWPKHLVAELGKEYYSTSEHTKPIPSNVFNKLKSKYLLKVQISKLKTKYVGCPRLFFWIYLRWKDSLRFSRDMKATHSHDGDESTRD
jgi:hypothetical protein